MCAHCAVCVNVSILGFVKLLQINRTQMSVSIFKVLCHDLNSQEIET